MKIELAHQTIEQEYPPQYGKDGNLFTLKVEDGKVVVVSRGGLTCLFKADGRTLNPQLFKLKNVQESLGSTRTELIQQKDQEIGITDQDLEELAKQMEVDQQVADNENDDPVVCERAH